VDAQGRAVQVTWSPGQHTNVRVATMPVWLRGLRGNTVVADKGYDSGGFRAQLRRRNSRPCILPRCNRLKPVGGIAAFIGNGIR